MADKGPAVRVVVADRSLLLRNLLTELADGHGIAVVGETARGAELIELCQLLGPDVVISDIELEDTTLEECLPALLRGGNRVLALCADSSPDRLVPVLVAGASGYLMHDASPEQVLDALEAVAGGAAVLDPVAAGTILSQWRTLRLAGSTTQPRRPELTPREEEVLRAMVEGLAAKAIAKRLGVATKTIENHKIRIFDKLGVRTQAQAVSLTISQGLLANGPIPMPT
jgi:DNA-binding NarL/FixJ family response regulator